ncbi:MAG: hypothetical protein AUI14_18955 [Actinobacteria bacterium 13_2_20CM_2_71_6]|nr:MAG: hypothetical protein AUI14_18955 [Actinobacteria bacterium 13_2_20CM_2_71_6]
MAVIGVLLLSFVLPRAVALANTKGPDWKTPVKKIPVTAYARDAKTYIGDPGKALQPLLIDKDGPTRLQPVLTDLDTRYFDGARARTKNDGEEAYENLKKLTDYLKSRLSGGKLRADATGTAYVNDLVGTLTGARQIADAAIQDAEATLAPFRRTDGTAATPTPPNYKKALDLLDAAKKDFAKGDGELKDAQPEPAINHAEQAWDDAFEVLEVLGITYDGDKDADGVTDVVELRFGASPLVPDSDADGLTDKFEIYQLAGITAPNQRDTNHNGVADGDEDVDGDGLTNLQEQQLGTSPTVSDTDHDGVNDGDEVRNGTDPLKFDQPVTPPVGGGLPPIQTTPDETDTDGDGLSDVAEIEEGTDPNNPDTDGDGISDGQEVIELGINPLSQDSDGDGLRDDYELVHEEDQGLDPGRPDEQVSKWDYVKDFLLGLFAGDFAQRDSMAWLAGNLCSGGLSLIPVVGWILGGIADIRDTIANLIHGDWVSAGLSIMGVVPYVGDAISIPGKAAKFALKFTHRIRAVLKFVSKYDKIPDSVKEVAFQLILLGTYDFLTGDDGQPGVMHPNIHRLSDAALIRLAKGDRTDFKRLEAAMKDANHAPGARVPFMNNGKAGEDYLENTLLAGHPGTPQLKIDTPGVPTPRSRHRKTDFAEDDGTGGLILHEVKTGVSEWGSEVTQCQKDAWIKDPANAAAVGQSTGGRRISAVHWHFFPHGRYNSLGPSQALLDCLIQNGIQFTIHGPNI